MLETTRDDQVVREVETPHFRIAIAGSGFAGIGLAVKLLERSIEDFVIFERADDLGGTWRDNTYPGCACDVPSHLYSFSFAPNPNWSNTYSPQDEIWEYMRDVAERFRVTEKILFDHDLLEASWNDELQVWELKTSQGNFTADVLVSGVGGLSEPNIPDIPGLDRFEGEVFHSAQWNHDYDLTGKRVAVVGTGASAIQFVPQIAPKVERLEIFQRTPPWVVPHRARPVRAWERRLYKLFPPAQRAVRALTYVLREAVLVAFKRPRINSRVERMALRHLQDSVPDPELRAKLTPKYRIGCKRILPSNDYYPALMRDNVELIASGVAEVRPHSVVAADGSEREVDAIILGIGFRVIDMPVGHKVRVRDGRTLAEAWDGSPEAYLGTAVAGCPNFFIIMGPNTGLGHNSVIYMIESQVAYIIDALEHMERNGLSSVEPTEEAQRRFVKEMDGRTQGTVWTSGGCASWYLDERGRAAVLWPGHTYEFRRRLAHFDPQAYIERPAGPVPDPAREHIAA